METGKDYEILIFKGGVAGIIFSELIIFVIEVGKPKQQGFFRKANQKTEVQILWDVISLISFLLTIDAIRKSLKIDKS